LIKTLSENGSVSRGVCEVDNRNHLVSIAERVKIYQDADGKITYEENDRKFEVPSDAKVSMNFWCFDPSVFDFTQRIFKEFLQENIKNPKAEFFIPIIGDRFIKEGDGQIEVILTSSKWFGVTYKEDAPEVKSSLEKLISSGVYPEKLWSV
jgi:hypothetical protein